MDAIVNRDLNAAEKAARGGIARGQPRVAEGIQRACERNGYHVLYASVGGDYNEERREVERMLDSGCDAIVIEPIVSTREQLDNDYLNNEHLDFPIVLVTRLPIR